MKYEIYQIDPNKKYTLKNISSKADKYTIYEFSYGGESKIWMYEGENKIAFIEDYPYFAVMFKNQWKTDDDYTEAISPRFRFRIGWKNFSEFSLRYNFTDIDEEFYILGKQDDIVCIYENQTGEREVMDKVAFIRRIFHDFKLFVNK